MPSRRLAERVARRLLDRAGYDLVRRSFDSPLPDVGELPAGLWDGPSALPGVDLRVDDAVALLAGPLAPYLAQFRPPLERPAEPGGFWLRNGAYQSVDAEVLYAMVRRLRPRRVHEFGSGASSHVIAAAARANAADDPAAAPLDHVIVDPFPFATDGFGPVPGATIRAVRAEDTDPADVDALAANDILFVDTSHTVRTGGDVTHLLLDVIPRVAAGVHVHLHDVFLPYEYPRDWVVDRRHAWAEQYLLQAFLAFNDRFEVVLPTYAVARAAPGLLATLIASFDPATVRPGAFWFRRGSRADE